MRSRSDSTKSRSRRQVEVDYQILFSDPTCSNATAPEKVMVEVKRGSTALDVMEEAVTDFGRDYRFSATYFGEELGYFIDQINGTASDVESSCFWFFFTVDRNGMEVLSPVGVSNFRIPKNGKSVIWRFMQFVPGMQS